MKRHALLLCSQWNLNIRSMFGHRAGVAISEVSRLFNWSSGTSLATSLPRDLGDFSVSETEVTNIPLGGCADVQHIRFAKVFAVLVVELAPCADLLTSAPG